MMCDVMFYSEIWWDEFLLNSGGLIHKQRN